MALGIAAFIWVVFLLSDNAFIDSPYFTDGLLLGILSVLYIFLSVRFFLKFNLLIHCRNETYYLLGEDHLYSVLDQNCDVFSN